MSFGECDFCNWHRKISIRIRVGGCSSAPNVCVVHSFADSLALSLARSLRAIEAKAEAAAAAAAAGAPTAGSSDSGKGGAQAALSPATAFSLQLQFERTQFHNSGACVCRTRANKCARFRPFAYSTWRKSGRTIRAARASESCARVQFAEQRSHSRTSRSGLGAQKVACGRVARPPRVLSLPATTLGTPEAAQAQLMLEGRVLRLRCQLFECNSRSIFVCLSSRTIWNCKTCTLLNK